MQVLLAAAAAAATNSAIPAVACTNKDSHVAVRSATAHLLPFPFKGTLNGCQLCLQPIDSDLGASALIAVMPQAYLQASAKLNNGVHGRPTCLKAHAAHALAA